MLNRDEKLKQPIKEAVHNYKEFYSKIGMFVNALNQIHEQLPPEMKAEMKKIIELYSAFKNNPLEGLSENSDVKQIFQQISSSTELDACAKITFQFDEIRDFFKRLAKEQPAIATQLKSLCGNQDAQSMYMRAMQWTTRPQMPIGEYLKIAKKEGLTDTAEYTAAEDALNTLTNKTKLIDEQAIKIKNQSICNKIAVGEELGKLAQKYSEFSQKIETDLDKRVAEIETEIVKVAKQLLDPKAAGGSQHLNEKIKELNEERKILFEKRQQLGSVRSPLKILGEFKQSKEPLNDDGTLLSKIAKHCHEDLIKCYSGESIRRSPIMQASPAFQRAHETIKNVFSPVIEQSRRSSQAAEQRKGGVDTKKPAKDAPHLSQINPKETDVNRGPKR